MNKHCNVSFSYFRVFVLLAGLTFQALLLKAQSFVLSASTTSSDTFYLTLHKYAGYTTNTVDSFRLVSSAPVTIPLSGLDTGLYTITEKKGAGRFLFVSKGENILIQLISNNGTDSIAVKSVETLLFDSVNMAYGITKDTLDKLNSAVIKTPRTRPNYRTITDSLQQLAEKAATRQNVRINEFIDHHPHSVALNIYRNLFLLNVRSDKKEWLKEYQTNESFQQDHYWDKLDFPDKYVAENPLYYSKIEEYFIRYTDKDKAGLFTSTNRLLETVSNNPKTKNNVIHFVLTIFKKNTGEDFYLEAADKYLNSCTDDEEFAPEKSLVEKLKKLKVGMPAPDITVNKLGGQAVTLSSLQGSPVILLFWASWCGHCRAELPQIKAAYEKIKTTGVKVLAISLDDEAAGWVSAINDFGLTGWINACEFKKWNSEAAKVYNVHQTPMMYIIDTKGNISGKDVPVEMISALIP